MKLRRRVRFWLHRRGWIASSSLAFQGVLFGPEGRDLAGEVLARIAEDHESATYSLCSAPDEEWP